MYLKQVELENFKSFGGKLTVPFMEGYTAVTGPNGSGKSNITDAILFVLGPKSSKAVRAGRLTDLIFDGGKSKNKAGYTKVSLVFDNADRLMPWDEDIVRLTRYVKLSDNGQDYSSYFYVNDRKSTMGEFDSLLTKARISADGYNLVQQGDVTRIVQMGNIERRRILDGISGIASYDADIDKAGAEEAEAEGNLERISIITDELSAEIERLEKDREDARRYLQAQHDLTVAKAQHSHRRLQMGQAQLDSQVEQLGAVSRKIEDRIQRKGRLTLDLEEKQKEIQRNEDEIASRVGPEYKKIKSRIENAKIDLATKKDRKETAEADLEEQKGFKERFEESMDENLNSIASLKLSKADLEAKLSDAEDVRRQKEAEEQAVSEKISNTGGEQKQLQEALEAVEAQFDGCSGELRAAQVRLAKAESGSEEAHNAHAALDEKVQSIDFEIKDARWSLNELKAESGPSLEDFGARILELKRKESELEKQEADLQAVHRKVDAEYNAMSAEKKVSERYNRGNQAVEAILALRDRGEMKGIHGTIQELATVEPGFETALSVAAGGKMQAVVVDDDQVAAEAIAYLKRSKLGRVTFLPLTKMMGGKPRAKAIMALKDADGYAIDLIDFQEKYRNAFWYVLGDTLIVGSMDVARRIMGGIRIVTVGGELIEASGAMVGGNLSQKNLLRFGAASEDRLAELGEKLRRAAEALEDARARLRGVRDEIRTADNEMREANSAGLGQREKLAQIKGRVDELEKLKQAASSQMRDAREKLSAADRELDASRKLFGQVSERMAAITQEKARIKDRIAEIAPVDLQNSIQAVRDALYKLRERISDYKLQLGAIDTEVNGYGKQNESLQIQLDSVNAAIRDDEASIKENEALIERAKLDLDALRRIERDMESGIEDLRKQKDQLMEDRFGIEAGIRETSKDIEDSSAVKAGLEAQIIISRQSVAQLEAEVAEIEVEVPQPIPSEETIRRRIRELEGVLGGLGKVNLRAIEDYDIKKTRYDSLMQEVASLNRSIKELTELMDSLSLKKKGLFMQSYDAVNENFKAIYSQLSGGGEAFMGLEDEDDPFNGGLMINAKPKNGKLLRLDALSGGEKSLTALSFIFAIQEFQPSPFYVLDEVDMFLDSVNAEMVAKRVKESSAKAQFIQVSLRKVTLALADHLIGVTRPPSGISKVIMQPDLAEVSKYEEQAAQANGEMGDGWEHKD